MGLFGGSESKVVTVPDTKYQKQGIGFLQNLLRITPDMPTQQVAGMSPAEQAAQSALMQFVNGGDMQDPSTSQFWKGLRANIKLQDDSNVAALRQRSQAAGMFNSSPSYRAEGDYRAQSAANANQQLGQLYQNERQYNSAANRAQVGMQLGSLPRMLQQQGMDANYQQQMQSLLFPYQNQAPIAQSLMNRQPAQYMQQGQQGILGGMVSQLPMLAMMGGLGYLGATAGAGNAASSALGGFDRSQMLDPMKAAQQGW